jgi:hypothetical protein
VLLVALLLHSFRDIGQHLFQCCLQGSQRPLLESLDKPCTYVLAGRALLLYVSPDVALLCEV